jgi:hypothetical protein
VGRAGRQLIFTVIILADRDTAWGLHRAQHAEEGHLGLGLPGADGAAAVDPVERGRHHLAGLRAPSISACWGHARCASGHSTTTTRQDPVDAWFTVIVMDVWHWTSLVALLAYAGLQSIPTPIIRPPGSTRPSRWAVFRISSPAAKDEGRAADRDPAALHGLAS